MKSSIIEVFIHIITKGKTGYSDRFYEIFSARGFSLENDTVSGLVRLSKNSHWEDCEFLEILQNVDYKKKYNKPHQDAISHSETGNIAEDCHVYFDAINTEDFAIENPYYLTELFTNKIPVDIFRLNWERDEYGKFDRFIQCRDIPKIRVYDLEPFIARLVKAFSSIGLSTWSSCEGHWGEAAYMIFNGKSHRLWGQTLFNHFIKKELDLQCQWEWWEERCTIYSPSKDLLELYLEIQDVARFIENHKIFLRNIKKQVCSCLTVHHKRLKPKQLLHSFETYFEESIARLNRPV